MRPGGVPPRAGDQFGPLLALNQRDNVGGEIDGTFFFFAISFYEAVNVGSYRYRKFFAVKMFKHFFFLEKAHVIHRGVYFVLRIKNKM